MNIEQQNNKEDFFHSWKFIKILWGFVFFSFTLIGIVSYFAPPKNILNEFDSGISNEDKHFITKEIKSAIKPCLEDAFIYTSISPIEEHRVINHKNGIWTLMGYFKGPGSTKNFRSNGGYRVEFYDDGDVFFLTGIGIVHRDELGQEKSWKWEKNSNTFNDWLKYADKKNKGKEIKSLSRTDIEEFTLRLKN